MIFLPIGCTFGAGMFEMEKVEKVVVPTVLELMHGMALDSLCSSNLNKISTKESTLLLALLSNSRDLLNCSLLATTQFPLRGIQ
ncbi:hypothetical protein Vadar_010808 [Vaccinium darrowii]|uniref:Uncharacterized protein n=1 Tax=Vaccinium darrowii TaxID=229202 RepID=A0ACB7YVK3_9ERIC|nr:hypothetical protein Vadar_010808 [Vaccinium darrowii]